jgi:hypothetical protein
MLGEDAAAIVNPGRIEKARGSQHHHPTAVAVPILMTDAAARAAELPCWAELGEVSLVATTDEAVSAELGLGAGRTNQNFIATVTAAAAAPQRYFVRIGSDIPAYGVSRHKEQAAGRAAAAVGLAPAVLFTAADAMVRVCCARPAASFS